MNYRQLFEGIKQRYARCNEIYQMPLNGKTWTERASDRLVQRHAWSVMCRCHVAQHYLNNRSIREGKGRIATY